MNDNKQKRNNKKNASPWGIKSSRDAIIGAPDALDDSFYLERCFIETDVYREIVNPANERSLLIGRTGSGKTACIQHIKKICVSDKHTKYAEIDVDDEFFGHLDGLCSIVDKTEKQNLVLLLKALWMHILVVHLARVLFPSRDDILAKFKRLVNKKSPESQLLSYMRNHEDAVWDGGNSAQIVKKITSKLGGRIAPRVALGSADLSIGHITGSREVVETKEESAENPQGLFSAVHLTQLKRFAKIMCDHIASENNTCYVLIDNLDTEWAPDPVRYMLIRVLTETVRFFYSVSRVGNAKKSLDDRYPVKIVVALRRDLLDKVNIEAKTAGFQSEKIGHFECDIKWSKQELRELVNKRIRRRMEDLGNQKIGFYDIFPPTMKMPGAAKYSKKNTLTYIEERTLQRPRDIIEFVNRCLNQLVEERETQLTEDMIKRAEEQYSTNRFKSVTEEWTSIYPKLDVYARVLHEFSGNFRFSEFKEKIENFLLNEECHDPRYEEWVRDIEHDKREVARSMLNVFCKTGLVMVRSSLRKSYEIYSQEISQRQCKPDLQIKIHPMFYAYFGVNDRNTD